MSEDSLKQKTKKGLYWTFFNQFADYGLQFIIGIILARLLSPEDYGITALPAVFIAVAGVFVSSGFGSALVRKPEVTDKDLSTAFYYSITVGVFLYLSLFISSGWIADFYNAPILESVLKFTALGLLFGPLTSVQSVQLTRKLDFKTSTKIALICKISTGVLGISMAFAGYGIWSLVLPSVFSKILNVLLLYYYVRWIPRSSWSSESFKYLWGFGNKMIGSTLLDKLYSNIVPVFVGKFYSPADLGVYNRAQGYAQLPSMNITGIIQSVTFPVLSKMQDDDEVLARNYRKMIRTTAFIVFPVMMLLSALARPLIIIMVTEKWEGAIILLQLMCFSMMWYPIHAMNLNLLQVKGRSDLFFRLEIIKKSYGLIALAVTLPISLIAVVLGRWVTNILSLFVNTYYTGKIIGITFRKQMGDLLPIMGLSLAMWAIVFTTTLVISNYYIQVVAGGIVGVIFYLGISILLKRPELQDVKYMLKIK